MSTWVAQSAVTILAPVDRGHLGALGAVLAEMAANPSTNNIIPLGKLNDTHYARLFLTEPITNPAGGEIPPYLVYMSDFDGSRDAHLQQLVETGTDGLDEIYAHCAGYPEIGQRNRGTRVGYLRARAISSGVVYVNTIGRTLDQIRFEAGLRDALQTYLDSYHGDFLSRDPSTIHSAIRNHVGADPKLKRALIPATKPPLWYRAASMGRVIAAIASGVILLPVLLPVGILWLIVLRIHEASDAAPRVNPTRAQLDDLRALEDHASQNQFTALGFVKPGWFRRITIAVVLRLVAFAVHNVFNDGSLAGVKTIHFARWVPIDGHARTLFASNYDGSTESYMDDFIDKLAWGLNAVFSNGVGYPSTHWLILRGARDEQAFKGYLRVHQLPTQVWFAAYPQLTAANIDNNARIRAGLADHLTPKQAAAWLTLL
jgi:hypothetical protein